MSNTFGKIDPDLILDLRAYRYKQIERWREQPFFAANVYRMMSYTDMRLERINLKIEEMKTRFKEGDNEQPGTGERGGNGAGAESGEA